MDFVYNDGGRSKYFKAKNVGDCVTRAICNATGKDYKEVYNALNDFAKSERTGKRKHKVSKSRSGVYRNTYKKYIESVLGWKWHPTMNIGEGCTMHLCDDEIPSGIIIVKLAHHLTCVKDGVIYDTYDCSEKSYYDGWGDIQVNDRRCVYGYWSKC